MILCPSCNFENDNSDEKCLSCGETILTFNSICGMPIIAGSSENQILNMRYIIKRLLSQDPCGCTYTAEDALSNSKVIIKALPLSESLDERQTQLVEECIKKLTSFSNLPRNMPKAFGVSGKVQYFVYDYLQTYKQADSNYEREDTGQTNQAVEFYKNEIEKLKAQAVNNKNFYQQKIQDIKTERTKEYEQLSGTLSQAKTKIAALEQENEKILELCRERAKKLGVIQAAYEKQKLEYDSKLSCTQQLYQSIAAHNNELAAALEQVKKERDEQTQIKEDLEAQIDRYDNITEKIQDNNELKKSEEQIKTLNEENQILLQKQHETEIAVNTLRTDALRQQQNLTEKLDKAQWKIETLSKEIEKLLVNHQKITSTSNEEKRSSKFKLSLAACIFSLILGTFCGLAINHFYPNYKKDGIDSFKKLARSYNSKTTGNNAEINFADSTSQNNFIGITPAENKKQPSENMPNQQIIALDQNSVNEQFFTFIEEEQVDDIEISSYVKPLKRISEQNDDIDFTALTKAAEKGDAIAMYKLGKAYIDTNTSTDKAMEWLKKAADLENVDAIFELGLVYYTGHTGKIDYKTAFDYFLRAAHSGHKLAMYNIGRMYHEGIGTYPDGTKTIEWYKKAAEQGLSKAMNQLAQMYYFGEIVEQSFEKAADYYELSAKNGDLKAMYNLAVLYHAGIGVEKDVRKSMLWFIKAAREGDSDSMYLLGELFESSNSIENDIEKAVGWYQNAARAGHLVAQQRLSKLGKTW
ncbi:MAG: hypothetical protein WCZ89_00105 [Phycisphaerae bacterium]